MMRRSLLTTSVLQTGLRVSLLNPERPGVRMKAVR
jgi:hypothetical protein